jgi:hypothetical protein
MAGGRTDASAEMARLSMKNAGETTNGVATRSTQVRRAREIERGL